MLLHGGAQAFSRSFAGSQIDSGMMRALRISVNTSTSNSVPMAVSSGGT